MKKYVELREDGYLLEIWAKPYRKKDGGVMLYINGSNKVSLGISGKLYTSKLTQGQSKLLNQWLRFIRDDDEAVDFTGDFENHQESKAHLALDIDLYITDTCNVGGQDVSSDGAYIVRDGKLIEL